MSGAVFHAPALESADIFKSGVPVDLFALVGQNAYIRTDKAILKPRRVFGETQFINRVNIAVFLPVEMRVRCAHISRC